MSGPFPDPISAAQTIPFAAGIAAALAAWPVWRGTTRAIDAIARRWRDHPVTAASAFFLTTFGGLPAGIAAMFVLGQAAGFVSAHIERPRCTIERFKPDGTTAGVMHLDGPCPRRQP